MLDKSQQNQLRGELKMLHELLENVDEVSGPTKEAMQLLADDIQRLLEEESATEEWPSVGQRWRDVVLDFEAQHPRLAQVMDQITNVLANAGI